MAAGRTRLAHHVTSPHRTITLPSHTLAQADKPGSRRSVPRAFMSLCFCRLLPESFLDSEGGGPPQRLAPPGAALEATAAKRARTRGGARRTKRGTIGGSYIAATHHSRTWQVADRRGEGRSRRRSAVYAPHPRRAMRAPRVHGARTNYQVFSNLHGAVALRCVVVGVRRVWRVARNRPFKRAIWVGNRVFAVSFSGASERILSSLDAFFGLFRAFSEVAWVRRLDMHVELGFPITTRG